MRAGSSGDKSIPLSPAGRCRRRHQGREEGGSRRIRDAAALALADGADELHRFVPRRQGRPHRSDAVAGRRAGHGREGARRQARGRVGAHDLPRRRLRPAHRRRLHRPGSADLEGGRQAGEAALDARRRHDARLLPAAVAAPARRRARRRRQADGDDLPHGLAVGHRARLRPAARSAGSADDGSGDGRLRNPGDAPRDGQARRGPARRLLAIGEPRPQRLRQRELHRRMRRGRGPGSVRVPHVAADQQAALRQRAEDGRREIGLGHAGPRGTRAASR